MGRFGAPLDEAVELGRNIATAGGSDGAGGLKLEGVYTHFSVADDDELLPFTRQQAARLDDTVASLRNAGVEVPMVHCANSAACMRGPEFHRDMVRMGISVYVHVFAGVSAPQHVAGITARLTHVLPRTGTGCNRAPAARH